MTEALVALLVALATALSHGATEVRPVSDPEVYAIIEDGQPNIRTILVFEGADCGRFEDEPCVVIVYTDFFAEVGP